MHATCEHARTIYHGRRPYEKSANLAQTQLWKKGDFYDFSLARELIKEINKSKKLIFLR